MCTGLNDPFVQPRYVLFCCLCFNQLENITRQICKPIMALAGQPLSKGQRMPLYMRQQPDKAWWTDFMSDVLSNGRRFRTSNVVNDFNQEALHIEIDVSLTSARLVRVFEQFKTQHGLSQAFHTDNGPEFLGQAFTVWAKEAGMAIQYISQESRIRMLVWKASTGSVERNCLTKSYCCRLMIYEKPPASGG